MKYHEIMGRLYILAIFIAVSSFHQGSARTIAKPGSIPMKRLGRFWWNACVVSIPDMNGATIKIGIFEKKDL